MLPGNILLAFMPQVFLMNLQVNIAGPCGAVRDCSKSLLALIRSTDPRGYYM